MKTLNPLCQVPTLALENDEIMTETAAIALMVLDRRPDLVILPSNSGHAAK
ncbi:glutathione S-transferase, N-terminal domain protein [Escherichia coli MP021566.1]|nr:glutathione S-transferase, N-terminal domain protein [Escherichia coli MP021566.1]